MSPSPYLSTAFFDRLLQRDRGAAEALRLRRCRHCRAALHVADYSRHPRGGPTDRRFTRRFSFCCSAEGCRLRHMPSSVRFLGRKVYFAIALLLCPAKALEIPGFSLQDFRDEVGAATRTLTRWRRFWLGLFRDTPFGVAARAAFMPPLEEGALPGSFLVRFLGSDPEEGLIKALAFLAEGRGLEQAF